MPIIDHRKAKEIPWRPRYRTWEIASAELGATSCSLHLSLVEPGAGAPLHTHNTDELIVILDGTLEVRLGDLRQQVSADHTVVVPPMVPHGFTCVGQKAAHILGFFPVSDPFSSHTTHYLEGGPPTGTSNKEDN